MGAAGVAVVVTSAAADVVPMGVVTMVTELNRLPGVGRSLNGDVAIGRGKLVLCGRRW